MIESFITGIVEVVQPNVLLVIFIASVVGVILGVIPGLSGLIGCALALPIIFTLRLPPVTAFSMLLAMAAVSITGGSMTAILMNIPGTEPNAATLLDGYPMTRRGESGRAIGAALTSSTAGGVIAVPMALVLIPVILLVVRSFKAPEMFFMIVLGLSFLAIVGRGTMVKGLISGFLGILIAFIGYQGVTGELRYTFGSIYLFDGLGVIPIFLGIFAIPEIIDLFISGKSIVSPSAARFSFLGQMRQLAQGAKDVFRHWWLWFRCSVIGFIIGVIPGTGATLAVWIAYGQAKQTSKHPEQFGQGCVEGVIAPESANNATASGALLTTLAFGIPGSTLMAIIVGAFFLVGIMPGPTMLTDHLDISVAMMMSIVIANIFGGIMCLLLTPSMTRLTTIHPDYLIAGILCFVLVGAFAAKTEILDIVTLLVFGLLGFFMKRFGYARPALALGFILGELFEHYFFHSYYLAGSVFFVTPISVVLIVITIMVLSYQHFGRVFRYCCTKVRK